MNGKKSPNKVSKDIGFITALYPTDSNVVAPIPHGVNVSTTKKQTVVATCEAIDQNLRLPNRDWYLDIWGVVYPVLKVSNGYVRCVKR